MSKCSIIEYPHCKDCIDYYYCKRKGFNKYRPKFIDKSSCRADCAYDKRCDFWGTPYDCPEFREWCYEDMEVAKELGVGGCYQEPLPTLFNWSEIISIIKEIRDYGEKLWMNMFYR